MKKDDFIILLLKYWRNCLADADRTDFNPRDFDNSEGAVGTPLSDVANGRISAVKAESLIAFHKDRKSSDGKKNRKRNNGNKRSHVKDDDAEITEVKVLVCPVVAAPIPEHGKQVVGKDRLITPVWIPAALHIDGRLAPVPDDPPWIPRNLLEPMETNNQTLGDLEASDKFLGANSFPPRADDPSSRLGWGDVWRYANEMLKAVAGQTLGNFSLDGFTAWRQSFILLDIPRGSAKDVVKFYDQLQHDLDRGRIALPALLKRYGSLNDNELAGLLSPDKEIRKSAEHLGQMNHKFGLSKSQREALHHALAMEDGEILAVNGPPGTGKTTLIQSIVASLWVEAALRGGDPPIIVATSTNNQAVTNVIESFGKVEEDDRLLSGRWIPDIKSYGLYCPAKSKQEDAREFQISKWDEMGFCLSKSAEDGSANGDQTNIETKDFVASAEKHFLDRYSKYAGQMVPDVKSAVEYLHKKLAEVAGEIKNGPELLLRLKSLNDKISSDYGPDGGIEAFISKLGQDIERCHDRAQLLEGVRQGWRKFNSGGPGWVILLNFIPWLMKIFPGAKQQLADHNESYFSEKGVKVEADLADAGSIRDFFNRGINEVREEQHRFSAAIKLAGRDKSDRDLADRDWNGWLTRNNLHGEPSLSPAVLESLDTTLRYRAFKLATHFWEGRWLLEIKDYLERPPKYPQSEQEQKRRWRRYAKLAPCVVVTLYKLEPFFNAFGRAAGEDEPTRIPLYEFIDWLIIDEAGQVAPDVAGANFSLAKKALVVGDVMQLKPVRGITPGIDVANMKKKNHSVAVSKEDVKAIDAAGFSVSEGKVMAGGNVMKIAQRASRFKTLKAREGERGMFLAEHRRCAREIIEYCNELAYDGRLEPMRETESPLPLPRLGYAHINGEPEQKGNSRRNPVEARVIARWIEEHQELLKSPYGNIPIEKIVTVVTPFRLQAQLIKDELVNRKLGAIKVGTVHVLQGAECPVVLFSTVYGAGQPPSFMNAEPNMLNVAVSRAKDSFLVFGNIGVLHQSEEGKPAKLLSRYLLASDDNEITDIELPRREDVGGSSGVRHLNTLEDHRKALAESLRNARRGVWITSPYIRSHPIEADHLDKLITETVNRGISVTIYTDPSLNYDDERRQRFKPDYKKAVGMLKRSGAAVTVSWFDHSKTLIADDELVIEGSFNWFSARRDNHQRLERSFEYRGKGVGNLISRLIEQTESRPYVQRIVEEVSKW
ncbi:MAG TPA: AAA domain-containing protein [Blastocatellia bacterium]|nr:AAA domain-containing protein [Blastocatellia bacterium]